MSETNIEELYDKKIKDNGLKQNILMKIKFFMNKKIKN